MVEVRNVETWNEEAKRHSEPDDGERSFSAVEAGNLFMKEQRLKGNIV